MKMNMRQSIHAFAAILLLLTGGAVQARENIGMARKHASTYNILANDCTKCRAHYGNANKQNRFLDYRLN